MKVFLYISIVLLSMTAQAQETKPFWTEQSSYIEGNYLYVIGIASDEKSKEVARKKAFNNGKIEISNFAQITNLKNIEITTQMTYGEAAHEKRPI